MSKFSRRMKINFMNCLKCVFVWFYSTIDFFSFQLFFSSCAVVYFAVENQKKNEKIRNTKEKKYDKPESEVVVVVCEIMYAFEL